MLVILFKITDHFNAGDIHRLHIAFENVKKPLWILEDQVVFRGHDDFTFPMGLQAYLNGRQNIPQRQLQGVNIFFRKKQDFKTGHEATSYFGLGKLFAPVYHRGI